jgi:hypothetical protein
MSPSQTLTLAFAMAIGLAVFAPGLAVFRLHRVWKTGSESKRALELLIGVPILLGLLIALGVYSTSQGMTGAIGYWAASGLNTIVGVGYFAACAVVIRWTYQQKVSAFAPVR